MSRLSFYKANFLHQTKNLPEDKNIVWIFPAVLIILFSISAYDLYFSDHGMNDIVSVDQIEQATPCTKELLLNWSKSNTSLLKQRDVRYAEEKCNAKPAN